MTDLITKLFQHITLAGIATLFAILIGVPTGIAAYRYGRIRNTIINITNLLQTIPSLALLAFLIPFVGIGTTPTVIALTLYGLLPIVRGTLVGLQLVPTSSREAALALGLTATQQLRYIELPQALPVMLSGIRTASAMNIGIATIAAFIGAGGLGDFITDGLSLDSNRLILMGAIPAALLALVVDYLIGLCEKFSNYQQRRKLNHKRSKIILLTLSAIAFIGIVGYQLLPLISSKQHKTIIVGSKNFTESFILADMMADMIRAHAHYNVVVKANLGSTAVTLKALSTGAIDTYPDYTGTYYANLMRKQKVLSAKKTYQSVQNYSQRNYGITWLKPFGFNNGTAIAVSQTFAKQHSIKTLSQLAAVANSMTLAAPPEFFSRPDSYPALQKHYGLHFKKVITMNIDLMYRAIANHQVDAILSFSTDGWLRKLELLPLADDRHMYPPYQAAPLINQSTAKQYPSVVRALNLLHNTISIDAMRHMNYLVDVKHRQPDIVAKAYLTRKGLLK